ncbi:hypothetical protein [Alishewanella longhuensis]
MPRIKFGVRAATLPFFSNGQYHNAMVIRIAGLAYQRGFGGQLS